MLNGGIHLTLMIGAAVPLPVSQSVLDALKSVKVTCTAGKGSGFQLAFTLSNQSPLHTLFLLSAGSPIPFVRVLIIVTINGSSEVLMDGMMTNHEVRPDSESGQSTLTVTGEDLSVVMDYIDFSGIPYPAMPREVRVAAIVAKYATLGIVPVVIPSPFVDVELPTTAIKRQQGRDLEYVRKLADEVGYVFYVEAGPVPGANIAYWGPQIRVGVPQAGAEREHGRAHERRVADFQFRRAEKQVADCVHPERGDKNPDPDTHPAHHAGKSAARGDEFASAGDRAARENGQNDASPSRALRHRKKLGMVRCGFRHRIARRPAIRPRPQSRAAGRSPRRGTCL